MSSSHLVPVFVLSKPAPGFCRERLCSVSATAVAQATLMHTDATLVCASWHGQVGVCIHIPCFYGRKHPLIWSREHKLLHVAGVFLRWNTDFDKSVLFVYNNGSTQRIFAAAWIPVEDAEEPVHPVSMETHAGGRGCKMTGKEQAEAK